MSEETLIIPTPYGKRKLCCVCNTGHRAGDRDIRELVTHLICIGCERVKKKPQEKCNGGTDDCYNKPDTRVKVYEAGPGCPECGVSYFVFINKSDEPEGA